MSKSSTLTPKEAAADFGVSVDRVYGWMRRGLFIAYNTASDEEGERPCYRIDRATWEEFKAGRMVAPVTPKPRTPVRPPSSIIEFC